MRKYFLPIAAAVSICLGSTARADVTVFLDLDLDTDGDQTTIDVAAGDTVIGAIKMLVTGDTRFSAYDFIMNFEQAHLTYGPNVLDGFTSDAMGNRNVPIETNRVNLGASGAISFDPFTPFDLGPLTDDDPLSEPDPDSDPLINSITGIAGGTFGTNLGANAPPLDPVFEIYNFALTATSEGTANLSLLGADTPFGDPSDLGVVSFGTGTINITAVPEPSALALCGLGIGVVAVSRRKKRKSAKA